LQSVIVPHPMERPASGIIRNNILIHRHVIGHSRDQDGRGIDIDNEYYSVDIDGNQHLIRCFSNMVTGGYAWDGSELILAALLDDGTVWRYTDVAKDFVHDESLDALGEAAIASNEQILNIALARNFAVFSVFKGGAICIDRQ